MGAAEYRQVIDFLEQNVIGRTVVSKPVVTRTNSGQTESSYVDQNFFSNLVRTPVGFRFDLTCLTRGQRFGLSDKGERVELAGSLDTVRVYRYDMTERPSTGQVLGFARFVSSTNTEFDPLAGTCFLVRMRMDGDDLVVEDVQMGYGDFVLRGGVRQPVASDTAYRYIGRNGKLTVRLQQSTFHVDPKTLHRTPTGDDFPAQVSEEFETAG
jgi:hypothetical protein